MGEKEIIESLTDDLKKAQKEDYMVADFNVYDIQGLLNLYNDLKKENAWHRKIHKIIGITILFLIGLILGGKI